MLPCKAVADMSTVPLFLKAGSTTVFEKTACMQQRSMLFQHQTHTGTANSTQGGAHLQPVTKTLSAQHLRQAWLIWEVENRGVLNGSVQDRQQGPGADLLLQHSLLHLGGLQYTRLSHWAMPAEGTGHKPELLQHSSTHSAQQRAMTHMPMTA